VAHSNWRINGEVFEQERHKPYCIRKFLEKLFFNRRVTRKSGANNGIHRIARTKHYTRTGGSLNVKEKQVLVPESFLVDIYMLILHLKGEKEENEPYILLQKIQSVVYVKIEAQQRRQEFTEYKTAKPNTEQREQARQVYLDSVGIHKDWRTDKEESLSFSLGNFTSACTRARLFS